MSTATETTLKGKYDEVAGKVKQTIGEATHNDSLANKGTVQQVKGHGEQAWGSVKQAVSDTKARHEASSEQSKHDARESVTSTAQNVKEHVQNSTQSK
jgi:uncharacterized protein YjbJ (UPF0337 family)